MKKDDQLSPKEKRFAQTYVATGGRNAAQAAIAAGYSDAGGGASARTLAYRLLHRPRVLQAIREETERNLRGGVALGSNVLVELAQKATSESVRLQAALALLDRGGMQLANRTEHHHVIEDNRTDAEIRAHIVEMSRSLGLYSLLQAEIVPMAVLPGSRADVEDVQSKDVTDARSIYD
jgi:phage terminase small subunit